MQPLDRRWSTYLWGLIGSTMTPFGERGKLDQRPSEQVADDLVSAASLEHPVDPLGKLDPVLDASGRCHERLDEFGERVVVLG